MHAVLYKHRGQAACEGRSAAVFEQLHSNQCALRWLQVPAREAGPSARQPRALEHGYVAQRPLSRFAAERVTRQVCLCHWLE